MWANLKYSQNFKSKEGLDHRWFHIYFNAIPLMLAEHAPVTFLFVKRIAQTVSDIHDFFKVSAGCAIDGSTKVSKHSTCYLTAHAHWNLIFFRSGYLENYAFDLSENLNVNRDCDFQIILY